MIKKLSILLILIFVFSLSLININATDYEFYNASYEATLVYPGYFEETVTVLLSKNDEPNWSNIVGEGVIETPDICFSYSSTGYISVTFTDDNHLFADKTFLLKYEEYRTKYDLIIDSDIYYLELADTSNCFTILTPYVNYSYEYPGENITWEEYVTNLSYPDKEHIYIYNDFVFFNDYALKKNDVFVTSTDYVELSDYNQSTNYHGHNWVDTRNVIQHPTCKRPLIIEQECLVCGNYRTRIDYSYLETSHWYIELESIPATCYESGYYVYQCEYCLTIINETFGPIDHYFSSPHCDKDGQCIYCGLVGSKALGHDLNWKGQCSRCSYKEDVLGGWWNNSVAPGIKKVGASISNFFGGVVEGGKEIGSESIEYIIPGEDGIGLIGNLFDNLLEVNNGNVLKKLFNVIIAIIFIGIIVIIICKIAPYVVKYFDFLKNRKSKKRRKRKKKSKKRELKK